MAAATRDVRAVQRCLRHTSASFTLETHVHLLDDRVGVDAVALAIGGTVGLDAMFGGPITGASMNPARSLGPGLVSGELDAIWVYLLAPVTGAALGAVAYQAIRGQRAITTPSSSRRQRLS